MTSCQSRCDVITSHRRRHNVILAPNARRIDVDTMSFCHQMPAGIYPSICQPVSTNLLRKYKRVDFHLLISLAFKVYECCVTIRIIKAHLMHYLFIYLSIIKAHLMHYIFVSCSSCACWMKPPPQGTKSYQAHYNSVCCVLRAQFCRRTPPPTFSDTAMTDRHSGTTFSNPEHTGCRYPGLLDRKKSFGHVPLVGVEPSTSCVKGEHPIH